MITDAPFSAASMAAGRPAAPEPMTTTSAARSQCRGAFAATGAAPAGFAPATSAVAPAPVSAVLTKSRRDQAFPGCRCFVMSSSSERRGEPRAARARRWRPLFCDAGFLLEFEEVEVVILADKLHEVPIRLEDVFFLRAQRHGVGLGIIQRDVNHQRIVVRAMNAFDDVQLVRMRLPAVAEPGLVVESGGIHDQRVALPMRDGIAHPGGLGVLRVLAAVGKNLAQ